LGREISIVSKLVAVGAESKSGGHESSFEGGGR
jgi:hypothetical protein